MRGKLSPKVAFILAGSIAPLFANAQSYSAGGFDDTSRFNTTYINSLDPAVIGNLRGQDSGVKKWLESGTTNGNSVSTAVVENTDFKSASQAILVTYRDTDNRWAAGNLGITPTAAKPDVVVSWTEKFAQTTATSGDFGPFFGIEGYDGTTSDPSGNADRLGALGVDASNDQINYFDDGGIETGPSITPNVYHTFTLDFNYQAQTFTARVDGSLIVSNDPFENSSSNTEASNFTDADISALNVGGGTAQGTGSAVFDDYSVSSTPEPTSMLLFGIGSGIFAISRRRRASAV